MVGEQPLLVLAGSPLLGSLLWEPVASVLRSQGHDVRVTPSRGREVLTSPEEALEDLVVDVPADRDVVPTPTRGSSRRWWPSVVA